MNLQIPNAACVHRLGLQATQQQGKELQVAAEEEEEQELEQEAVSERKRKEEVEEVRDTQAGLVEHAQWNMKRG